MCSKWGTGPRDEDHVLINRLTHHSSSLSVIPLLKCKDFFCKTILGQYDNHCKKWRFQSFPSRVYDCSFLLVADFEAFSDVISLFYFHSPKPTTLVSFFCWSFGMIFMTQKRKKIWYNPQWNHHISLWIDSYLPVESIIFYLIHV